MWLYKYCVSKPVPYEPVVRKLDFCLCENKGTDQLCSKCMADQRLCFRYTGSTISPSTYTQKVKNLAFLGCVSDLVGNSEEWLSNVTAHTALQYCDNSLRRRYEK